MADGHKFRFSWRRSLLVLLLSVLLLLLWQGRAIAESRTLFIAQARRQPNGAEIVITGRVTVPSGQFASANLDQGFAIQDPTGGIYITTKRELALQLGDTIKVRGTLMDDGHGQRMVKLAAWQQRERSLPSVAPQSVSLQVAKEQLQGQLVTVQGEIVGALKDDAPYGDRLWIADETGQTQIYMPKSTAIAPHHLPFLQTGNHIQVTGFSSQFDGHDEIIPRSSDDLQPLIN